MTVVVQLRGGLGNQLFQYAAGVSVSSRHQTDLDIDVSLLPAHTVSRGGVRRWPALFLQNGLPSIAFPRPMFGESRPVEPKGLLHPDWIQVGRD